MALDAMMKKQVFTRDGAMPARAVEAEKKAGIPPGDLAEKVNPSLRPLTTRCTESGFDRAAQELGVLGGLLKVATLAFMRGRTLN